MEKDKYVFKLLWRNRQSGIYYEIGFSILRNDRQQAFETAYEKAMSIHKNMCMKDKDFSNKWYYAGIELITVIPDYWR